MDIDVHRERRNVPVGAGPSQSGQLSSSAIGGGQPISYIQAARSGAATFRFEHTHLINTWGNAYSISTLGKDYETKCMITGLANIPVHCVSFWMSYAEYKNLPRGTRIISVECMVIPKGFKTSFDTGVSITSSANNTQGVFGQVGVGLNRHILCREFEITRDPTKPMKITALAKPKANEIAERLWGYPKFDAKFDSSIPTCMGIPRSLKIYLGVLMPFKSAEHNDKNITTGWPDMMKCTKTFNYLDHIEKPVVYYQYKVKTNTINTKKTETVLDDTVEHKTLMGGEDIRLTVGELTPDGFTVGRVNKVKSIPPSDMNYETYLEEMVEHCHSVTIPDHTPPNSGHAQPTLHVGILPIQSNAPDKELQDYVTACATWEVG